MPIVPVRGLPAPGTLGVVVYDANLLFARSLSYILLHVAAEGLVQAKFSSSQLFEAGGAITSRLRFDALAEFAAQLKRMEQTVRDNEVRNFQRWVPHIRGMTDQGDKRILATAIQGGAWLIATNNIKDFPAPELARWGVEVETADQFLCRCLDTNPTMVVAICDRHRAGAARYVNDRLGRDAPRAAKRIRDYI